MTRQNERVQGSRLCTENTEIGQQNRQRVKRSRGGSNGEELTEKELDHVEEKTSFQGEIS